MAPLVSIIMPAYNAEKYIEQAIQTIQNQTFTNWELLIVDDLSTDTTVKIVKHACAKDRRISIQQLNQNSGTGVARNTALQKAQGRYIAFLDADDLWREDKLEKQLAFMQANNYPFCFSHYDLISSDGIETGTQITAPDTLSFSNMFTSNWIGNLTAIYDSEKVGKLTIDNARKRQDWTLWLDILRKVPLAHAIPESLAFYRIGDQSVSSGKVALLKHNYNVYRKFHKLSIFASLASMVLFLWIHFLVKPVYIKKLPQK
ncbi:glycosyltransferase family 2 protein [Flavobacterium ardleyense]|uniref:glycosyltransferase family 2 protein n=1 Tax=Flavobacterium ardleyense TaxID=2038737 RepID=UPI00298CA225|nr:glycosyltransferase family 2 protein [Flavobacterium ardleyense]